MVFKKNIPSNSGGKPDDDSCLKAQLTPKEDRIRRVANITEKNLSLFIHLSTSTDNQVATPTIAVNNTMNGLSKPISRVLFPQRC